MPPSTLYVCEPDGTYHPATPAALIEAGRAAALAALASGPTIESPVTTRTAVQGALCGLQHEVFGALYLDSQHRVIGWTEHSTGTLAQATVYPRELVKRALAVNAAAVILAHNHPSGGAEPSRADERLTQTIKAALQLVDVSVLDHLIVTPGRVGSFAELGLL